MDLEALIPRTCDTLPGNGPRRHGRVGHGSERTFPSQMQWITGPLRIPERARPRRS